MPEIHCPHCGQAFESADAPPPMMAYATPEPGMRREAKWISIARISMGAAGILVAIIALGFSYSVIRHIQVPIVAPLPANFAAQIQQSQQFAQAAQKQQTQAQQQVTKSMETSGRLQCAGNMMQIGVALQQYARANGGAFPPQLNDLLRTHFITRDVLNCPANDVMAMLISPIGQPPAPASNGGSPYIYVPGLTHSASADTIVLYEPLTNHGGDGMNVLYHNGHVAFLEKAAAAGVIAEIQAGYNPPRFGHY